MGLDDYLTASGAYEGQVGYLKVIYSAANAIMQVRFLKILKMSFTISTQGFYGRFLV